MGKLMERIEDIPVLKKLMDGDRETAVRAVAVVLIVVVALAVFMIRSGGDESLDAGAEVKHAQKSETGDDSGKGKMLFVDIGGEVNNPMVVQLKEGSRVEDAIESAGGLTANADITDINRAAVVNDGDKIFIPSVQDTAAYGVNGVSGVSGAAPVQGSYSDGKININTADSEQLQELTGVGPVTAEKIISYRSEHGRFSSIEELKNVSGIGDKTYEKLKDSIRV